MPFTSVEVVDFQSIATCAVELGVREGGGGITTIVGPSSTGKSALMRAVRMLVRNTSSVPVRAGAKKATVTVTRDDGTAFGITRGPALSTYTVDNVTYAKAGVSVPDEVAKALGLREDTPDPHFSFQFDKPFLLSEPGSVVSNVIGRLTNANVLRAAVREGARRAQNAKQEQALRIKDAKALAAQIKERFATLPAREQALANAQEAVSEAVKKQAWTFTLADLVEALDTASTGLAAVSAAQRRFDDVYPVIDAAEAAWERWLRLESVLALLDQTLMNKAQADLLAASAREKAEDLDAEYHAVLDEAGVCPTCGAKTGKTK